MSIHTLRQNDPASRSLRYFASRVLTHEECLAQSIQEQEWTNGHENEVREKDALDMLDVNFIDN